MKRWSIKARIIFWYTIFFALLIIVDFYFLRTAATNILTEQAYDDVVNATIEMQDVLQVEDDNIYVDEGEDEGVFRFYHDGVLFLVYDGTSLAYGNIPENFDANDPITLNVVQTQEYNDASWLVYDVQIEKGHVLRGIYDLNPLADTMQRIIMIAGILSPIIILLAAVGGYIIIKRSFKPIQEIYQTASAIKDQEDYSKRVQTTNSKDEVNELALMVNQMLDQVEQSISREKQFSSNVSHELRTPLTVMQAQAEYMMERVENDDTKEEIKTIMNQVSFMENIVTQLLEITRTKQISENEMESLNLYELIKITADSFSQKLESKRISIDIIEPREELTIHAHQTMMIRVFSNLINNAIKYNKENGSIKIELERKYDKAIISITDTGIGIAKEHVERIFNPFYRVDESRTQKDESLGLGLALVREVLRIHGGDIKVVSMEHIGTTFIATMPLSK